VEITAKPSAESAQVLTSDALVFLEKLEREFGPRRCALLEARAERQKQIDSGIMPDFLPGTAGIRESDWAVASVPDDLQDRRVEITGPTDRKMMINALNSGASVFMADFEDANSPTWKNMMEGHINLRDAIERIITYASPDGKAYRLNEQVAVLMVRPRGWHLVEKHARVNGEAMSASLFDFGLHLCHNARRLIERGSGPYFYLPKLESHEEARLWDDVFTFSENKLGLLHGTIKATVLIETVLAAFEMDEILYELRDHSAGLNAGRWDYIFSIIKKFRSRPDFLLPDRGQITMTVPFMRAYTQLLVKTCHRRGAHAIGGMAAYIPSRKDAAVNEAALEKVREDKVRESRDGFDGTWVAHPDLVPTAKEVFDEILRDQPNQKGRLRPDVHVSAPDLLDFRVPGGAITEEGLRHNINVGLQYLDAWLRGSGAVAIYNLMEDTATAEISRAQVWHWVHHPGTRLADGREVTQELYRRLVPDELEKIRRLYGDQNFAASKLQQATSLFNRLILAKDFPEFLTLMAYDELD
jgi:malate synthase